MGLLEDNVPDRYTCYICRDPPGETHVRLCSLLLERMTPLADVVCMGQPYTD